MFWILPTTRVANDPKLRDRILTPRSLPPKGWQAIGFARAQEKEKLLTPSPLKIRTIRGKKEVRIANITPGVRRGPQDFAPDRSAIATSAPISVAGKSCPTTASAMVSDRANGSSGAIVLPTVVRVAKLK